MACGQISLENILVKAEIAVKQINSARTDPAAEVAAEIEPAIDVPDLPPPLPTHFARDVDLDSDRYTGDIKSYIDEVASYMMNLPNAKTSIRVATNISRRCEAVGDLRFSHRIKKICRLI